MDKDKVQEEFVKILFEFFSGRRTRFIPAMHLSKEAYEVYTDLKPKI